MVIDFEADKVPNGAKVVLCSGGCSKALARIMFDDNLESIGSVKVTAKEQPNEPKPKEKEVLEIKLNSGVVILMNESVSGEQCHQILEKLWPVFSQKDCKIVCLSSVYKTNYSTHEGSL